MRNYGVDTKQEARVNRNIKKTKKYAYTEIWSPACRCCAILSMLLMFFANTALLVVDCDSRYLHAGVGIGLRLEKWGKHLNPYRT
jgi:hypothetical protein